MRWVRALTLQHWAWIHFKVSLIVWMATLLAITPTVVLQSVGGAVILFIASTVIGGGAVSIAGIVMSAQGGRTGTIGLTVELSGLVMLMVGPVAYFIIQAWLTTGGPAGSQRAALTVFAYAMVAALLCRLLLVARDRSKAAHVPDKAA